jgi:hypothetical protein
LTLLLIGYSKTYRWFEGVALSEHIAIGTIAFCLMKKSQLNWS